MTVERMDSVDSKINQNNCAESQYNINIIYISILMLLSSQLSNSYSNIMLLLLFSGCPPTVRMHSSILAERSSSTSRCSAKIRPNFLRVCSSSPSPPSLPSSSSFSSSSSTSRFLFPRPSSAPLPLCPAVR